MCRLVAYVGEPVSPAPLVFGGSHSLYQQSWAPRELLSGSVNADGYGVVWYAHGRPGRIAEVRPIWYDDDLQSTLSTLRSPCVLAALRNGTPGLPVDRSGLLPMVHDRWSFVLNGFVPDFRSAHMRALRRRLPDELYGSLRGSSDSETLFLLALAVLEEGASLVDALRHVVGAVREQVGSAEAQLTMVLSDGQSVAAVRTSTVVVSNSLYLAHRPPVAPAGVVLASEAIDGDASWSVVEGHSWVHVSAEGDVTTEPL